MLGLMDTKHGYLLLSVKISLVVAKIVHNIRNYVIVHNGPKTDIDVIFISESNCLH